MQRKSRRAFTLAELLIALAVLGVIATFTIPKLLQNQADSQKKAVLRETIATLSQLTYEGVQNGELCQNPQLYFRRNLNFIKACNTNVVTQGCWVNPVICGAGDFGQAYGFVLANGSTLSDFDISSACGVGASDGVIVDWNGTAGPNVEGDDQIAMTLQYAVGGGYRAGTVHRNSNCAASGVYFEDELWKN